MGLWQGALAADAATTHLEAVASVRTTHVFADGSFTQVGSVQVTPGGRGTITLRARLRKQRVIAQFRVTVRRGSLVGHGSGAITPTASGIRFAGSAAVTGGSGAYARVRARNLRLTGRATASLLRGTIRISGTARR